MPGAGSDMVARMTADVLDPMPPEQLKKEIDKEYEDPVVTINELGIKF